MKRGDKVFIATITPQGERWIEWEVFIDYQDGTFIAESMHEEEPKMFRLGDIRKYVPKEMIK